jgi:imidazole glycerol-phosphate synthase subunit HisF
MLTKRIIPCLDIKNGRTVKGTNFVDLRDAGDPVALAKKYSDSGADELVFLDIAATQENRSTLIELVKRVGAEVNIPFSVGGGISDINTAYNLLQNGADKISINSSAVRNPDLITDLSRQFGEQCVIVAIDAKFHNGKWMVYTHGGTKPTEFTLLKWAKEAQERGAGEILFTSMDHDGTKNGFACEMLRTLNQEISIPIIASGGAGNMEHFLDLFEIADVSAGLAASIFHYQEVEIAALKTYLSQNQINVRL